jgi:nicotinic acid mononucleotide adenylyltransferase
VTVFELEPVPVSGTEVRRRVAAGEPIDDLVPPAVAAEIEARGLYRDERLHSGRSREDSTKP